MRAPAALVEDGQESPPSLTSFCKHAGCVPPARTCKLLGHVLTRPRFVVYHRQCRRPTHDMTDWCGEHCCCGGGADHCKTGTTASHEACGATPTSGVQVQPWLGKTSHTAVRVSPIWETCKQGQPAGAAQVIETSSRLNMKLARTLKHLWQTQVHLPQTFASTSLPPPSPLR